MQSARFYEKHNLVVEDIPVKEVKSDEVKIRVRYCGVCGTDVHIYEGDEGSAEMNEPTVLGHELSGDVVEVGSGVTRIRVGDKVAVDPNDYCGMCHFCANGKPHFCKEMMGLGTSVDGGFAEYLVVKEHLVFRVSESVSYESASMIEPISCCVHGIELTNVKLGDVVMVVGTGTIGLIMVQLAKHMGASRIIAVEPSEPRRLKARSYGADILIDPLNEDTKAILDANHIENVDKVIDCAGRINTAEYALKYAGKGATVMLFGLTAPEDVVGIKPFELFRKELTIKASFVNPNAFEKSVSLLEAGIVNVDDIITDIVELKDINTIFEQKLYNKDGKVLVKTF